ncbi:pyridoxamine 5'-phosphate oxidase [Sporichthya polymorpha]|uniref:pyridoxamine 5'-phosphate oxidase n=1 Tax=Sporichthya polymorpha TaxID=35751 RepID=UPI000490EC24|nr:pyridoxamine 5'-phosphate oxidase [Sporichthya polymorpha]
MADLSNFARVVEKDHGLSIVSVLRADGTIQSTLVNAGVLDHPTTGEPVVGFVAVGKARKLALLRERPRITVAVRGGWEYAVAEGEAELIGPDDPAEGVDAEHLRVLLREVFTACGGTHDDWDTYDRVMREERRTAVLIRPDRTYPAAASS